MRFRIVSQLFERNWLRGVFAVLLLLGAASGITLMQWQRLQQNRLTTLNPKEQEQQEDLYIRSLQYLPTQGFGFNNLIADWTFLRFLQYYGDSEAREETGYSIAPEFFEVISLRDPRFVETYLFSSGTLSYELGMPEEAIKILDRGIAALDPKLHERAFTLWTLKGLDQLLLLGDAPGAATSYAMAAEWAQQDPDPEMRPVAPVLQRRSEFLKTDPDSKAVRLWAWTVVYRQAKATGNDKTAARARAELLLLGAVEEKDASGESIFKLVAPKPSPSPQPTATTTPEAMESEESDSEETTVPEDAASEERSPEETAPADALNN